MREQILSSDRFSSIKLRDGRRLAWHEWGRASDYPVLFCTGAGMSGSLGFGISDLEKLGLRLIAIDRPGLGGSDPHPQKNLQTWCDDISELLREIRIHAPARPLGVGFSQGAPFAFALAARGMVEALAIVSGQDDFNDPAVMRILPPDVAGFVRKVQARDPAFLESFSQIVSADGFLNLILSMSSEKDRQLYSAEPFRSAYHACLREGFRQGAWGYVQDLVNVLAPWPFKIEDISVPVDFWYGGHDSNATHSPDFGLTLSRRFRNHQTRRVLKDEGGSLLWTRSGEILRELRLHVHKFAEASFKESET